jgi:hypothetical protein
MMSLKPWVVFLLPMLDGLKSQDHLPRRNPTPEARVLRSAQRFPETPHYTLNCWDCRKNAPFPSVFSYDDPLSLPVDGQPGAS